MAMFDIPDLRTAKQSDINEFMTRIETCVQKEHDENRALAKKGHVSEVSSSVAFNKAGQATMSAMKQHMSYIQEKIKKGDPNNCVTRQDIQNAASLEQLAVIASCDPKTEEGKWKLDRLEKGQSTRIGVPTSHSRWKLLQINADRADVLQDKITPTIPIMGGPQSIRAR